MKTTQEYIKEFGFEIMQMKSINENGIEYWLCVIAHNKNNKFELVKVLKTEDTINGLMLS